MEYATIDEYHRTMIPSPGVAQSMHLMVQPQNLPKVPGFLARKDGEFAAKRDSTMLQGLPDEGLTPKDYWEALVNTKYSPALAAGLGKDEKNWAKLQKQTGNELKKGEDNRATLKEMEYYLAIRRSCKYGLAYVCSTTSKQVKVHFALDEIDLTKIAAKELHGNRLIVTGSELRFAYRNWDKFKVTGKILFYIEGDQVSAPWEQKTTEDAKLAGKVTGYADEGIWAAYEKTRTAKTH